MISLNIKCSKANQGAVGVCVIIGRTNNDLCPVSEILVYLARRGNTSGALFQWDNRICLSKTNFVDTTHRALSAATLPAKDFAGHSFICAATTAATAGLEESTIQILRSWKSTSYQLYIRTSSQQLATVSAALSRCHLAMTTTHLT